MPLAKTRNITSAKGDPVQAKTLLLALALANLAVGLIFASRRGCFDKPRPATVHVLDLEKFSAYAARDPAACLAEYKDRWVLVGATVVKIDRVKYDFSEKWYVHIGLSADSKPPHSVLEFESDSRDRLGNLMRGDSIVVVGRVVSLQMIDHCELAG